MPGDRQDLRRALHAVAFHQAGYFTAAQAVGVGYSHQAQKYHADHGNWLRVDRGLFRLPEWPTRPTDNLVRWTLWSRGLGVVSHESALDLYELSDANPARVHLTVPPGFRAKDPAVVTHTAVLSGPEVRHLEGFRVTSVERTLLDMANSSSSFEITEQAISEALRRGLATRRTLRKACRESGTSGAVRLLDLLLELEEEAS